MQIARYFAMGVKQTPDGEFVAGKSDEVLSALSAVRKARSLARQNDGAVAFKWRGDVEFGHPGSIEILAAFGELPPRGEGAYVKGLTLGRAFPIEINARCRKSLAINHPTACDSRLENRALCMVMSCSLPLKPNGFSGETFA